MHKQTGTIDAYFTYIKNSHVAFNYVNLSSREDKNVLVKLFCRILGACLVDKTLYAVAAGRWCVKWE